MPVTLLDDSTSINRDQRRNSRVSTGKDDRMHRKVTLSTENIFGLKASPDHMHRILNESKYNKRSDFIALHFGTMSELAAPS